MKELDSFRWDLNHVPMLKAVGLLCCLCWLQISTTVAGKMLQRGHKFQGCGYEDWLFVIILRELAALNVIWNVKIGSCLHL